MKLHLNKKIKNRLINYFRIIQISIFTTHKIIKKENIDIVCFQDPVSSFFNSIFKVRRAEVKIVVETLVISSRP